MSRRSIVLVLAVALAAAAAIVLRSRGGDAPPPPGPAPSPAILAVDGVRGLPATVAELPTIDVDAFDALLGELHGTPVVVNLWASWCEPCTREMPMLARAARTNPEVQFLGIDTTDARASAEAFIAEHRVPFPSLFDPDGALRTDLDSFGLPVTVFIDADGRQAAKVDGELTQGVLDGHLADIAG